MQNYQAAQVGPVFRQLDRRLLRLSGPDRQSFLQGMVTNDVASLMPGQSCLACALTAKGAMVADLRVFNDGESLLLDADRAAADDLYQFLNKHLISEDAELSWEEDLAVVSQLAPVDAGLEAPPAPGQWKALPGLWNGAAEKSKHLGTDYFLPKRDLEQLPAALSPATEMDEATWTVLRVEAGIPQFGADMSSATIPLEAHLERAIHFKKGCYVGQEVIVRASSRGQMARQLAWLKLGQADLEPGALLVSKATGELPSKKAGWLCTVVDSPHWKQRLALGYVQRDFLAAGTALLAQAGEGQVREVWVEPIPK